MQRNRGTAPPILTNDAACLTFYSRTLCDIQLYYRCLSFCFLKQHRIFRNSRVGRWKTRELKTISGPPIDSTRLTHNITSEVNEGRKGGKGCGERRVERKEYVKYLRELDLLLLPLLANASARKVDTNSPVQLYEISRYLLPLLPHCA